MPKSLVFDSFNDDLSSKDHFEFDFNDLNTIIHSLELNLYSSYDETLLSCLVNLRKSLVNSDVYVYFDR